jgi:hypothetical protein
MSKTYAEMLSYISVILQDSLNAIFDTAELDLVIPEANKVVSRYLFRQVRHTATTTASSRDITLSTENKRNLLWIDALEYKVDQYPQQIKNFTRWGNTVTMLYDGLPVAGESVYLYLAKVHTLQKEIGTSDLAGAIKTLAAVGATSLALKSLGTGTIKEDTKLTIAGDSTEYQVVATATITTNEATVSIYPALVAQAAVDAVVTLALADSTLDATAEELLAEYAAGMAAVSKSAKYIPKSNIVGTNAKDDYIRWGEMKKAQALQKMQSIATSRSRPAKNYSRS